MTTPHDRPENPSAAAIRRAVARLPAQAGRALVTAYRYTLSPYIGMHCRYVPTCSQYADDALGRFGLWAGGWMTLARLMRCRPGGWSGLDLVPDALPARARWYLPWRYGLWRGVNDPPDSSGPAHTGPSRGCGC